MSVETDAYFFLEPQRITDDWYQNLDASFAAVGYRHGIVHPIFCAKDRTWTTVEWHKRSSVMPARRIEIDYHLDMTSKPRLGFQEWNHLRHKYVSWSNFNVMLSFIDDGRINRLTVSIRNGACGDTWERHAEEARRFLWLSNALFDRLGAIETVGIIDASQQVIFHFYKSNAEPLPSKTLYGEASPAFPSEPGIYISEPQTGPCTECLRFERWLRRHSLRLQDRISVVPLRGFFRGLRDVKILYRNNDGETSEALLRNCICCGGYFEKESPSDHQYYIADNQQLAELRRSLWLCHTFADVTNKLGEPNFELPPLIIPRKRESSFQVSILRQLCYTQMFETWIPIVRIFADGLITVLPAGKRIK